MGLDRTGLPRINCSVSNAGGNIIIHIEVDNIADADTAIALTKKLAFPLATTITEFYKVEPPTKEEFYMSPDVAGSVH